MGLALAEELRLRPTALSCQSSKSMLHLTSSSSPPLTSSRPRRRTLEMCVCGAPVFKVRRGCPEIIGRMAAAFSPVIHSCDDRVGG
eukprot:2825557-Prymnesium_polylepis.1